MPVHLPIDSTNINQEVSPTHKLVVCDPKRPDKQCRKKAAKLQLDDVQISQQQETVPPMQHSATVPSVTEEEPSSVNTAASSSVCRAGCWLLAADGTCCCPATTVVSAAPTDREELGQALAEVERLSLQISDMGFEQARLKQALQMQRTEMQAQVECILCMDVDRDSIFFPCMHAGCCYKCAVQHSHCPQCRVSVTRVARVYSP